MVPWPSWLRRRANKKLASLQREDQQFDPARDHFLLNIWCRLECFGILLCTGATVRTSLEYRHG
jgi:hypothetical protein